MLESTEGHRLSALGYCIDKSAYPLSMERGQALILTPQLDVQRNEAATDFSVKA